MFNFNKSSPETKDQTVSALEERVKTLEQQNASIMQEMHNMCVHYNQHIERLERRITDFTDVWHPMMTSNIVRIKDELVADMRKDSHLYIDQNIKTLLPASFEKKKDICMDPMSGCVIIGSQIHQFIREPGCPRIISPVFLERNASYEDLLSAMRTCSRHFIVDSIASFPEIKKIDLADLVNKDVKQVMPTKMIDIDGNVICSIEKLDKVFAKYGVELLYEGKPIQFST
jgi:hypothetical protein